SGGSNRRSQVKNSGDLAIHFSVRDKRAKARRETIEVGIISISPHLSTDRMLAGCARLPDHPDPDPSPLAVLVKDHLLDKKAQDLFALGRRRGCRIPQLRQILA